MEQAEQLLVTHELVRRLEDAERAAVKSKLKALRDEDAEAPGVETSRLGQISLLANRSRHYNPSYNRAMGFSSVDVGPISSLGRSIVVHACSARSVRPHTPNLKQALDVEHLDNLYL